MSDMDNLLLKALIALDAMQKGNATSTLMTILGQHLIVSESLCAAGFAADSLTTVRKGHGALVQIDLAAKETNQWKAAGDEYIALRDAMLVYRRQLSEAPRKAVRNAQLAMLDVLNLQVASLETALEGKETS